MNTEPRTKELAVVVVINGAGSSGKSTTSVNLATLIAESGRNVLLTDFDPQATATKWIGLDVDDPATRTSIDVLHRRVTIAEAMQPTDIDNLWVLPASRIGMEGQAAALATIRTGAEFRFQRALSACPDEIDVVIVDCPGTLGAMQSLAALVAATAVVTVAFPATKELEGIPYLEELISEVRMDYNPTLELGAIVPCSVPPQSAGKLYVQAEAMLREAYGEKVTPSIPQAVAAKEALSYSEPLSRYAPKHRVTQAYRDVLAHITDAGLLQGRTMKAAG